MKQCGAVFSSAGLSGEQRVVFDRLRQGYTIPEIAGSTGMEPKACYRHAGVLIHRLKMKNLTELSYFVRHY
jgi:DNA-binding NarL/FixJ family response regulator